MMTKRKIAILALCLVALVSLAACGTDTTSTQDVSNEATRDLQINIVTLDNYEEIFKDNDLTVLNIWGTWCPPCVDELPHLQEVSERFKDKNVQIVGVLQDGVTELGVPDNATIESAKTLLSEAGVTYTVILPDEALLQDFIEQMQYFPTTFFINSKGEVVRTEVGAKDADEWEAVINEVLQDISE